jgi:serine/threonine protein kinase
MAMQSVSEDGASLSCLSQWEMDPDELELLDTIGYGSTSTVYKGRFRGVILAVKELDLNGDEFDESSVAAFERELEVWPAIDHPHILRFIGLIRRTPPLKLCSEFCAGGSVFDLLHNCWHVPLSWKQRVKMLWDTSSAMEYLHAFTRPIMHRDLKSLNLLLLEAVENDSTEPSVKLADFGFARTCERSGFSAIGKRQDSFTKGAGTLHWMEPEVSKGTKYHEKVDVFSFAIICYEGICRHMAVEDLDADAAGAEISAGNRPTDEHIPDDAPPDLVAVMRDCWAQEPNKRPSFVQTSERLVRIHEAL